MTWPLIVAGSVAFLLCLAGGLLTKIGSWYRNLRKPSWQPPGWLFGPAWTLILALAAWSAALGWTGSEGTLRAVIVTLFTLNALFHLLWSPLFFTMQRPDWALVEVPFLWFSILALTITLAPISALASWLMVPYLLWVSFATVLNWKIVQLNRPFGHRMVTEPG